MRQLANIKTWLLEYEEEFGEPVEAIVVGKHDDRMFDDNALPDENIVLSREAGLAKLDQDYSNGFGGADCYPFYAWTKSRVFFMCEYDGSTGPNWVPRAPQNIEPEFM